jgi:hypothetical protein
VPEVKPSELGIVELVAAISIEEEGENCRFLGYIPYALYTGPSQLGDDGIFMLYNRWTTRVELFVASTANSCKPGMTVIGESGLVVRFDTACAWCGSAPERLKKCPCMWVSYCGPECQAAHWSCHKTHCSCAKRSPARSEKRRQ